MKILIVDNEIGTRNALEASLTRCGHQVSAAAAGGPALEIITTSIAQGNPVSLVVTDLRMPGMTGLELISAAKKVSPDLAFILMSAYGSDDVRKEIATLNSCGYIEKPFVPEVLMEKIESFYKTT